MNAFFRVLGKNPTILSIESRVKGTLEGKPIRAGEIRGGQRCPDNFISIEIIKYKYDKKVALRDLVNWFNKHARIVKGLQGWKWVEIKTYLAPDQAYEQIELPASLLYAAVKAGCEIVITCHRLSLDRPKIKISTKRK